ncbi:MAG: 50S ribosomal protein L6 [Candidatus Ryanbacteria bacterium RIFCSPHIGHO2_02_FULL_45_13b]|uniref:Large ribosomal subunit protein uL6 n=1 Tax=Candidatus Ryanbacteria bacterium RIFCSPHIGHO2_02_FULL_45_13b TaxID=1802117 RepID=A0A1G2G6N3_9BACT|nr:MAG: 50S ribosomal protein L6 [Candidatus Ryanbacteria bacterium RIFCSPHIGHO2_02_FULL_45_13b]
MTRLSSKPIRVPAGVTVSETDGFFVVNGPKGTVSRALPRQVVLEILEDGRMLTIVPAPNAKDVNHLVGSCYAHAQNMIIGVSQGFTKVLELEGIGYRASMDGRDLVLSLGFSHPIRYTSPVGIDIVVEKSEIRVSGIDKEKVGQAAAVIREYRKPEPYKGKGIRYKGEHIIRKAGKKAGVGA